MFQKITWSPPNRRQAEHENIYSSTTQHPILNVQVRIIVIKKHLKNQNITLKYRQD